MLRSFSTFYERPIIYGIRTMQSFSFTVVIPARMASSRFPGKALAQIHGKPMIQHVYEKAVKSGAKSVIIATDHIEIKEAAEKFGAQVCMTALHHPSGTDRISEVAEQFAFADEDILVNVQGDEPGMPPENIHQVALNLYLQEKADMATLCWPIVSGSELFSPNQVKVVTDINHYALYFSRAPIPWSREQFPRMLESASVLGKAPAAPSLSTGWFRHLGIYAYSVGFIKQFVNLPVAELEKTECLEQLRALYQGYKIHVAIAQALPPIGVDTPEDLEKVRAYFLS